MLNMLINNIEWIFSGAGCLIVTLFVANRIHTKKILKQKRSVSKGSSGIQVGGNVTIKSKDKDE